MNLGMLIKLNIIIVTHLISAVSPFTYLRSEPKIEPVHIVEMSISEQVPEKSSFKLYKIVTIPTKFVLHATGLNLLFDHLIPKREPEPKDLNIQQPVNLATVRMQMNEDIQEIQEVVGSLYEILSSEEARKLVVKKSQYIRGQISFHKYFNYLMEQAEPSYFEDGEYPNLAALYSSISGEKTNFSLIPVIEWDMLFEEIDQLHYQILKNKAHGITERLLIKGFREFDLIEKIVFEDAIATEIDTYYDGKEQKRLNTLLGHLNRNLKKEGKTLFSIPKFQNLMAAARTYYNHQVYASNLQERISSVLALRINKSN